MPITSSWWSTSRASIAQDRPDRAPVVTSRETLEAVVSKVRHQRHNRGWLSESSWQA